MNGYIFLWNLAELSLYSRRTEEDDQLLITPDMEIKIRGKKELWNFFAAHL
jgi:hypothetical protein